MKAADLAVIQNWPTYPPEFEDLDYALRDNGWLDEHRGKPDTRLYVAEQAGKIIAFTLLSRTSETEAEFRIALRADKIGLGLGSILTRMTLEKGFVEMQLARIHLIVRKNNPRAIGLYRNLGFTECGECAKHVNGQQVNFLNMALPGNPCPLSN
jgi:RimJ/RimL family protein N-acetyltransferase